MQRFDCLAKESPLLGLHLLEASAGTGKTFSIEHIYVRLVLESISVEELLVVTFTRAATRELKARIRTNLEKTVQALQTKNGAWPYLELYENCEQAIQKLTDALAIFDRCQIFTIHGFCYRMLKEFAFEAKIGAVADPDLERGLSSRLKEAVFDFLAHGIDPSILCPEQIGLLLKQFSSVEEMADRLLRSDGTGGGLFFTELVERCKTLLHEWSFLEEEKLLEDFRSLEKNYKAEVKGDFKAQVKALSSPDLRVLLKERGTLFDFLSPENRKVRAQDPPFLHYPGFFEWASIHIAPLTKQKVWPVLQAAWKEVRERVLAKEEILNPDALLARMKQAVEVDSFVAGIRKKYQAVMIDEFQDTDGIQWDIFRTLFLHDSLKALYLVGDPKQSIYRFRKADVYTYLQARDLLGESHVYQLDTNFRSSKQLLEALNALFARDWLHLPKLNRTLPYHPVKAGSQLVSDFSDGKGAVHFFIAEGEPNSLFQEAFLPFTLAEIERLNLKKCAILVKDRYQAQMALEFCKKRGISAVAKSQIPLGKTVAFQAIRELFDAILMPRDFSAMQIVTKGPFGPSELPLVHYKELLEEKGVVAFAREIAKSLDADGMQIFELLFEWEQREGFSFEGLRRFLKRLQSLDPEEGGRRRMEVDEEAVQIMTLHISKGLEFEVVFALGLVSRTPIAEEEREEFNAEKQRQLYVAMTRAKKRLYVPIARSHKDPEWSASSPLELFARGFEGSFYDALKTFSQKESISVEEIASPFILEMPKERPLCQKNHASLPMRSYVPCYLSSFTTLAQGHQLEKQWNEVDPSEVSLQTMPRGTETGIILHALFENLFTGPPSLWREGIGLEAFVEKQLRFSSLFPWKEPVRKMVGQILSMPLQGEGEIFSLTQVEELQVEMEFLFSRPSDFVKGFIDLVFSYRGKIYWVDWKTNWLEEYSQQTLKDAMIGHDYYLQASLYTEAISRYFGDRFGGAFYFFLRGETYLKVDEWKSY